jgi:tetratricopeptide (TPR) repeat protein
MEGKTPAGSRASEVNDSYERARLLAESGDLEAALVAYTGLIECHRATPDTEARRLVIAAAINSGWACEILGHFEGALDAYAEASALGDGFSDLDELVADALNRRGDALVAMGRFDEAAKAFADIAVRFADSADADVQHEVAYALLHQGRSLEERELTRQATTVYADLIDRFRDNASPEVRSMCAEASLRMAAQTATEDPLAAVEIVEELSESDRDLANVEQVRHTAHALLVAGFQVGESGAHGDSIKVLRAVDRLSDDSDDEYLIDQVARAQLRVGWSLIQLERDEDATDILQPLAQRMRSASEPQLRVQAITALYNLGEIQYRASRFAEARALLDDAMQIATDTQVPEVDEVIADAALLEGFSFEAEGRDREAALTFGSVADRFDRSDSSGLRERVAKAWILKARALFASGQAVQALTAYERMIAKFSDGSGGVIREQVASALFGIGVIFESLGRTQDAVEAYRRLVSEMTTGKSPVVRELLRSAEVRLEHLSGST